MNTSRIHARIRPSSALALVAALLLPATLHAQSAYGVTGAGMLFGFNLNTPATVADIGSLGFTPEAIDFRPGTSTLYAIDVNSASGGAQLYTVNTATGAASAVGTGFISSKLVGATSFGFDFNPGTLQGDGSIRIRLTANNNANLRLHSNTGGLAATDTDLTAAGVGGSAYINSDVAVIGGATTLYDINFLTDFLVTQAPPNNGVLNNVGTGLGAGIDVGSDIAFDIFSAGSVEEGYLVNTTGSGLADLYFVDLTTGAAVLEGAIARDFSGGFAIDQLAPIPEPASFAAVAGILGLGAAALRRRRSLASAPVAK